MLIQSVKVSHVEWEETSANCYHSSEGDQSSGKPVRQTGGDCRVTPCCHICDISKLELELTT